MIKINLVAETPAGKPKAKGPSTEFSLGARQGDIILVGCLLIAVVATGGYWWKLDTVLDERTKTERDLTKERDDLADAIKKVEDLAAKRDALAQKITVINQIKRSQRGPVRILDEVSRALPDLVWLEQLELEGTQVKLKGYAMEEVSVANYISNLDSSPFFDEPDLIEILIVPQQEIYRFELVCNFQNAKQDGKDGSDFDA